MLVIPEQYSSLEFIKDISWREIFNTWNKLESWQKSWKKHWEKRGFVSWEEWREAYAAPLQPEALKWFLYCVKDPLKDSPFFYGVPSRSWVDKAYSGERTKQLRDILELPIISENPKIIDIKKNFPEETMLTAVIHENKIVLIEGIHRACALAGWDPIMSFNSKIFIALAQWPEKEIPILGGNYKK